MRERERREREKREERREKRERERERVNRERSTFSNPITTPDIWLPLSSTSFNSVPFTFMFYCSSK